MLSELNTDQRKLAEYMSDLSEQAYYASWMKNLAFDLWKGMNGIITEYGLLTLTHEIIEKLKNLSQRAGGWIVFDDKYGETFIDWDEWENLGNVVSKYNRRTF
ncbi:hypothetical protein [Carboxylicivirga linearis]|uniref:Uncharacterized protein n=1 Tax=Carboxylicivirga linearis TaxID=1628157 RepID=A0ABS5K1E4_9BACT|nr:hypothetical protein [Carboxylicivirga linearis]MBS2100880.1 hypothetical protein [Carboxylicivirga linearis]